MNKGWLFAAMLWPALGLADEHFAASMGASQWAVKAGQTRCELIHQVPQYGEAIFRKKAGRDTHFYLTRWLGERSEAVHKAHLQFESTGWSHNRQKKTIATNLKFRGGQRAIRLNNALSQKMMAGLLDGTFATFTYGSFTHEKQREVVGISPVNFKAAYEKFLTCTQGLLPYTFKEVAKNQIYFASGSERLDTKSKAVLEKVARYVLSGAPIDKVVLKGFSDSVGNREINARYSVQRVTAANDFLIEEGVPEEMLIAEAYGDTQPIANNKTKAGRAKNRRVTIELVPKERLE